MPSRPRMVVHGYPVCSTCHHPRPPKWFNRNARTPLGLDYQCRECRGSRRKLQQSEPDAALIPISRATPLIPPLDRVAHGGWARVVRRAMLCTQQETIEVSVGRDYYSHNSAHRAIAAVAKRLKVLVAITHGRNCVYVRPM